MGLPPARADESRCHPERCEGSAVPVRNEPTQILRFAQNDKLSQAYPWAAARRVDENRLEARLYDLRSVERFKLDLLPLNALPEKLPYCNLTPGPAMKLNQCRGCERTSAEDALECGGSTPPWNFGATTPLPGDSVRFAC